MWQNYLSPPTPVSQGSPEERFVTAFSWLTLRFHGETRSYAYLRSASARKQMLREQLTVFSNHPGRCRLLWSEVVQSKKIAMCSDVRVGGSVVNVFVHFAEQCHNCSGQAAQQPTRQME